jgi:hypothetical protein
MSSRPYVLPCSIFRGRSPKTGQLVGSRHSWSGGEWGTGRCRFCDRTLSEVLKKPTIEARAETPEVGSKAHLARALRTGD